MKRLFIAVPIQLSNSFQTLSLKLQQDLKNENIVWVNPELQHLTLRFLGKTPDNFIPPLIKCLKELTNSQDPFEMKMSKIGVFGSKYAPSVLWYGFDEFNQFKELFLRLEPKLLEIGFEKNYGNFVPHLTIGRIKKIDNKKRFTQLISQNQPTSPQIIQINELQLIRSKLDSNGPNYTLIEKFEIK